jgi:hypothetical protein
MNKYDTVYISQQQGTSTRYWTATDSAMIGTAPSKMISHPTGWEVADVAADEVDASVDIWLSPCFLFLDQKLENGFMVTGKNPTIVVMVERMRNAHWAPPGRSFVAMLGQETRHGLQMFTLP